jgi:hypothetical protein
VTHALDLFDKKPERYIVSWNTMISILLKNICEQEVFLPCFQKCIEKVRNSIQQPTHVRSLHPPVPLTSSLVGTFMPNCKDHTKN